MIFQSSIIILQSSLSNPLPLALMRVMRALPAILLACFLLPSCGSPPKSFYLLTAEGPLPSRSGPGLGVGPVSLAGYLDRPNLIYQESDHRLTVVDAHRWAGDLADNLARVLSANLGRARGTGNVRVYPWENDAGLRYQITLDVRQLHGTAAGDAVLDVTWRAYALPERRLVTTRSWSETEPLEHDGYDALVAAHSRLLARLAADIARRLP